jgi:UDP-N-acetylglucosamine 2-epimerase (non-hydrolysing)
MKLCILIGTRPEIIKMSPIIRQCERRGLDYFIVHTGQHYSYEMDRIFFEELHLPQPGYNLDVGSGSQAHQTGAMMAGIEDILKAEKPDVTYVQGDTNTVLAGALAASKLHVRVGHVEAGLRSFDRTMPEEINRVVADHISDLLFAPTMVSRSLLLDEGIPGDRIFITGNTVVDAVRENLRIAESSKVLENLGLIPGSYLVSTVHRQENVDDPARLADILAGIGLASRALGLPVVMPVHPRTKKMVTEHHVPVPGCIRVIDPLGFMDFLKAEASAALMLTDSGGVQEECCILGVPCVTLRDNTERPETIQAGANMLAGHDPRRICESSIGMARRDRKWENPFGDGNSGKRILEITERFIEAGHSIQPLIPAYL